MLQRQKINHSIHNFSKTPWCSGYHICLTRRRSPVRSRVVSLFSLLIINLPLNHSILNVAASKNQSFNIQLFKTPWCSGNYHICLTRRRSPVRSRAVSLFSLLMIDLALNRSTLNVGCRVNQQSQSIFNIHLFKRSWCSSYHICLTRRRSPVRSRVVSLFSLLMIDLALNRSILNVAELK